MPIAGRRRVELSITSVRRLKPVYLCGLGGFAAGVLGLVLLGKKT